MLTVSRTVTFSAAHRLFNPAWSRARNQRVYGRCSNECGHGHNYTLTITVSGPFDAESGMVVNVTVLGEILKREVVDKLDHCNLNTDVPFLKGVIPTMENLVLHIADEFTEPLAAVGIKLVRLDLAESETNRVTLEIP
jgi:6-pyruvoyltetrahydropterin/6-carboxytetrahydropterin synthase